MRLEGRLICGMDIVHAVIGFGPVGSYIDISDYYTKAEIDAAKQDKLVSGTNIKTINNQSLLGSGNINIQGGGGDMTNYYTKSETNSLLNAKQDALTFDAVPTENSDNPVTSGGLHTKFLYVETDLAGKANSADLAEVATSGDYDDLSNKPTIPAAQVQSNWNESDSSSKAYILNKPTIPTVPTNVSAFTNDAGYLTQHQSLANYYTKSEVNSALSGKQATLTFDTTPTANSTNPVTSGGVHTSVGNKADKVAVVEVAGVSPTQTLAPNTFYKFTGAVTSLTLTLGTPISGITNIYAFSFVAGASNPTISLPASVTIDGTPSISAGQYVEFSIMNNVALFKVVSI